MARGVAGRILGCLLAAVLLPLLPGCRKNPLRAAVEDAVEPHAAFSVSASEGSRGDSFAFYDQSSGAITSWAWDFDADGSVDSRQREPAAQVFDTAGYHDVSLRVSGPAGSDELRACDCIGIYGPGIEVDRVWAHTDEELHFTDRSIITGTITEWTWYWEWPSADLDTFNVFATASNPTHSYDTPGQYTVSLMLDDGSTKYNMEPDERVHLDISTEHFLSDVPDGWPADCQPLILAADLDGHSDKGDIVATGTLQRKVYVWLDDASAITGSMGTMSNWPRALTVADLNGDSKLDIVSAASTGSIYYWENEGAGGFPATETESFGDEDYFYIFDIATADIDGDDDVDVAAVDFAEGNDGKIIWFENGNSWTEHDIAVPYDSPRALALGDLNNDTHVDIVSGEFHYYDEPGELHCWINNKDSVDDWTRHTISASANGPISFQIADIDGDGNNDVVAGLYGDDTVIWYKNGGDGSSWASGKTIGSTCGVVDVNVADLDGDSDPDVLVAGTYDDEVVWFENPETGEDWRRHVVDGAFDGVCTVYAADIDGDGKQDVLGSARYNEAKDNEDKLAWWKIR